MSTENDPFEMLKKKLEAKKKGIPAPASPAAGDKPAPRPATPPQPARQPQPLPAKPFQPAQPDRKPGIQSLGGAGPKSAGPADPGAPPKKLVKSLFATEDLKKMAKTTEQVSGEVPENYVSHRFDAKIDEKQKKVVNRKTKVRVERPKGFKSDRFDRG